MNSYRFSLNSNDWHAWCHNFLLFSAPLLIAFFYSIMNGVSIRNALILLWIATIHSITDLIRKYIAGETDPKTLIALKNDIPISLG